MLAIIDYGMGNLGSIHNMLRKIGTEGIVTSDPQKIIEADKLILPGVGSFDEGMKNVIKSGLYDVLTHKVLEDKVPVLGICLGMQLMFESSEEGGSHGLGWISGQVNKFNNPNRNLRIPHMGWNEVEIAQPENKLLINLPLKPKFYFVHSYYVECNHRDNILLTTQHGLRFTSGVNTKNIWGVQFHPEKSHNYGMKILSNFIEI